MRSVLLAVLLAALPAAPARAEQKPLWEAGLGVAAVSFPNYRGSKQTQNYVLPAPYLVYRGEILRADRDGARAVFFDSDRIEFNLSLNASLPVKSDDDDARRGMPDLKPALEIGPSLDVNLWRSTDRSLRLDFRLPVRYGFTIESQPKSVGWVATPRINLDIDHVAGLAGWNLGVLAGPLYATRRNHQYFYSVAQQFANPERPAFDAPGGYSGAMALAAVSRRFSGFWMGAFVRGDTLSGAAFEDSPLVKTSRAFSAGFAIAWILGESKERVDVRD